MGVDIYMKWKGQTPEEEQAQITGFSIRAGSVGYLRASYNMTEELEILQKIFPNWDEEPKDFDFKEALKHLQSLLDRYAKDDFSKTWAKSLTEFLELGIKLKNEGKEPTFYISY